MDADQALNKFIGLHELREELKVKSKQLNREYKELNDEIYEYLTKQPGQVARVSVKYAVQLRTKKKTSGLNIPLIGEGYCEFHGAHGRKVPDAERDSFIGSLKALRKTKTELVQEVNIVVL